MKKALPGILIGVALVAALLITARWPAIHFAQVKPADFLSYLGTLLVFALLIERTIEVFLTIWRAEGSYKKEAAVKRLIAEGKSADDPALKQAQEELIEYKVETQRWALPCTFFLGLLLASFGVRVIDQFLALPPAGDLGKYQAWCLHAIDIVLTAALLAGGADPIHKLMDAFRKFMEATSAKASGTTNT